MSNELDAPNPFQTEEGDGQDLEEVLRNLRASGEQYLPEESQAEADLGVYQRLIQDEDLARTTDTLRKGTEETPGTRETTRDDRPWRTITYVEARIVEIHEDRVCLECVLDRESEILEERVFDRPLFEGHIQLEVGKYIVITILQKPGEKRIKVNNDNGLVRKDIFELDLDLDELDSEMFNEPLQA